MFRRALKIFSPVQAKVTHEGHVHMPDVFKPSATGKLVETITELLTHIPHGEDVIYYTPKDPSEINKTYLGEISKSDRKPTLSDLQSYLHYGNSPHFLSVAPHPQTIGPYRSGLPMIPRDGYIMTAGLPKVYTNPQTLLTLAGLINKQNTYVSNIMIALTGSTEDDWRPLITDLVSTIIHISGPVNHFSSMMPYNTRANISIQHNQSPKKHPFALEVVLLPGENKKSDMERFSAMNQCAHHTGLIDDTQRLLTIDDAQALMRSSLSPKQSANYNNVTTTIKINSAPKDIPLGDEKGLIQFVRSILEARERVANNSFVA